MLSSHSVSHGLVEARIPGGSDALGSGAVISDLLLSLYGATDISNSKPRNFLNRLKQLFGLQHATIVVRRTPFAKSSTFYTSGSIGDHLNVVSDNDALMGLYGQDPLSDLPFRQWTLLEDLIPRCQLAESKFNDLYFKPLDIYYLAGIDWPSSDGATRISLRLARNKSQGPFGVPEKSIIDLLIPHFEQTALFAMQMRQLRTESQIYADALSKQPLGMITLDSSGQILQSNARGQEILLEGDGLHEYNSRINLNCNILNRAFNRTLKLALTSIDNNEQAYNSALAVPRDSGKTDYQLLIKPLSIDKLNEQESRPCVVVLIKDPEQEIEISVRALMDLYQLTVSEASVAILMAGGRTTDEVAEELNVKKNTIRTHLRAMFAKMGVKQQSKLVSVVLNSLAAIQ